ncbi:MAG: terminase, partial [bacterium]|nr:terminase [bacterium]MDZ4225871.1 terminase [Patescibacteria group bacterium]
MDLSQLHDKRWRMDNLYFIVDRDGNNIKFKLNAVQRDVFDGIHNRNLILKARQLGMSTFAVLYLLDEVIFNFNFSAGIVSYSLQHAQHIYKRIIGHALQYLPRALQP